MPLIGQQAVPFWVAPFGVRDGPDFVAHEAHATLLCWRPGVIKGDGRWKLMLLDTNLKKRWDGLFEINNRYELGYSLEETDGSGIWLFFKNASEPLDTYFLYINYASGSSESVQLRMPIAVEPELLLRTTEGMYMKATYEAEPIVLYCDLEQRRVQVLPKTFKRQFNICGMAANPARTQLWLFSKGETASRTQSTFQIFEQGEEVGRQPVHVPKGFELGAAFAVFAKAGTYLMGTLLTEETDYSQGTFYAAIAPLEPVVIERYSPFRGQPGFYAYLGQRRAERARQKDANRPKKPLRGRYYHHAPRQVAGGRPLLLEHYYYRDPQPMAGPYGRAPYMPGEYLHDYMLVASYDTLGNAGPVVSFALPNLATLQVEGSITQSRQGKLWYLKHGELFTLDSAGAAWEVQDGKKLGLGTARLLSITQKLEDAVGGFVIWGEVEMPDHNRRFFVARVR